MEVCGENLPDKENRKGISPEVETYLQGGQWLEQSSEGERAAEPWRRGRGGALDRS